MTLISKIRKVNVISETTREVAIFVWNLRGGKWNLPILNFSNISTRFPVFHLIVRPCCVSRFRFPCWQLQYVLKLWWQGPGFGVTAVRRSLQPCGDPKTTSFWGKYIFGGKMTLFWTHCRVWVTPDTKVPIKQSAFSLPAEVWVSLKLVHASEIGKSHIFPKTNGMLLHEEWHIRQFKSDKHTYITEDNLTQTKHEQETFSCNNPDDGFRCTWISWSNNDRKVNNHCYRKKLPGTKTSTCTAVVWQFELDLLVARAGPYLCSRQTWRE